MSTIGFRATLATALLTALPGWAQIKVEVMDLAPPGQWLACSISSVGVHTAVLATKGSGFVVLVDGIEGPAFDQLLPIDGRPLTLPKTISTTTRIPVIFSDDGLHHAYIVKRGEEFIVIRDAKEVSRGKATTKIQGLAFSPGGKLLAYVESEVANKHTVVINGKAEAPIVDIPKFIFSPDGARYAYLARRPGEAKPSLFVDGQPAGFVAEEPQFTADNRLVCISRVARDDHRLMIDGQPLWQAKRIVKAYVSPVGNQLITSVGNDPQAGQHLVIDGRKVPGSECNAIRNVFFSPDGKRYAALARTQEFTPALKVTNVREFMIIDGKKGPTFHSIRDAADGSQDLQRLMWINGGFAAPGVPPRNTPGFTADSSRFVYLAAVPPQEFVVVDEEVSEPFQQGRLRDPLVNRDGKHIALVAIDQGSSATIVVEGKKQDFVGFIHSFSLSPDGKRHAYVRSLLCVDGVDQQLTVTSPGGYLFSPDSKHLAVVGQIPGSPSRGLFINGKLAVPNAAPVNRPVFTPDSRHLFWLGTRTAAPGQQDLETAVLKVDGRTAVQFRELINTKDNWSMSKEGVLTFVARAGDGLKRFRVTPSRDTSVTAMVPDDNTIATQSVLAGAAPVAPVTASPQVVRAADATAPAPAANPPAPNPADVANATLPPTPGTTLPGPVGDAARQVDQTTTEAQRTKAEIEKAKASIKSLWDTIAPKKK